MTVTAPRARERRRTINPFAVNLQINHSVNSALSRGPAARRTWPRRVKRNKYSSDSNYVPCNRKPDALTIAKIARVNLPLRGRRLPSFVDG